jgi:hypothetical protein
VFRVQASARTVLFVGACADRGNGFGAVFHQECAHTFFKVANEEPARVQSCKILLASASATELRSTLPSKKRVAARAPYL